MNPVNDRRPGDTRAVDPTGVSDELSGARSRDPPWAEHRADRTRRITAGAAPGAAAPEGRCQAVGADAVRQPAGVVLESLRRRLVTQIHRGNLKMPHTQKRFGADWITANG